MASLTSQSPNDLEGIVTIGTPIIATPTATTVPTPILRIPGNVNRTPIQSISIAKPPTPAPTALPTNVTAVPRTIPVPITVGTNTVTGKTPTPGTTNGRPIPVTVTVPVAVTAPIVPKVYRSDMYANLPELSYLPTWVNGHERTTYNLVQSSTKHSEDIKLPFFTPDLEPVDSNIQIADVDGQIQNYYPFNTYQRRSPVKLHTLGGVSP